MSAASGLRNAGSDAAAPAESSCPVSRGAAARVLRAWNIADLRRLAKKRLPRAIFDFFDGAAEDEITLRANRAAFERVRLAPKVLAGVARIDTSATILGARSRLPIAIGPTGGIGFGWPFADVGVARAAAAAGIPYTLSTMATASIERIAREAGGRLWFQAYIFRQRDMTLGLVERARQFGFEALMVTVDVPVGGKRERDFRNDFAIRFRRALVLTKMFCPGPDEERFNIPIRVFKIPINAPPVGAVPAANARRKKSWDSGPAHVASTSVIPPPPAGSAGAARRPLPGPAHSRRIRPR